MKVSFKEQTNAYV